MAYEFNLFIEVTCHMRSIFHCLLCDFLQVWLRYRYVVFKSTHVPSVPELNKLRTYAIPLVRPLPIPLLHDWMKMEVCFINFNQFLESILVFACRSVRPQRLNICLTVESIPLKICCSCIFMNSFHWFQDCLQNLRVIFAMAWSLPFYWTNIFSI
jgi:hypothetical protein